MTIFEYIKKKCNIGKNIEELIRKECPFKYLEDSAVKKKIGDRCAYINCFDCWNTNIKLYGIENAIGGNTGNAIASRKNNF